jgi:signal transduction histidine kinase
MSKIKSMAHRFIIWFQKSLRFKVTIAVVLPLIVVLGIFSIIEQNRQQKAVLDNLSLLASQSGRVIEASLQHSMLESDFSEMQNILNSINQKNEFRVIHLLDTDGKVVFAPFGVGTNVQLDNTQADCQVCHRLPSEERPESVVVTAQDGQTVFRSMYPINNAPECSGCHDPEQNLIGLLLIDVPVAPMEALVTSHLRENLLWWVGTILATILIVNLAMSQVVIRRLEGLAAAIKTIGHSRAGLRISEDSPDEIGQLANSFNEMSQRIDEEAEQNQLLSDDLRRQRDQRGELLKRLITAQEDERKRIARELHDDLGQMLSALLMQTEVAERQIFSQPQYAINQLEDVRSMIREAIDRMYDLIMALRPSLLDDLGLATALKSHAERFLKESGITFEMVTQDFSTRLDADVEIALYRIFQEALNNVCRHSGATRVRISLCQEDGYFIGEIQDNGKGFDPQTISLNQNTGSGYGLLGIKERVGQLCGDMRVESELECGTLIQLRIPIKVRCD